MINRLEPILLQKQHEVAALRQRLNRDTNDPIAQVLRGELPHQPLPSFKKALRSSTLAVIAEIKRQSPSKGMIAPIPDPVHLAQQYILGGASALSVLTDKNFFGGDVNDLIQVANAAQSTPIIRKDFVIDELQIAEALVAGASAVLCIVAVLGAKTRALLEFAHSLNLAVLVEIHDQEELKIALDCGAEIIGVNNRNLKTFTVDTACALKLVTAMPNTIIKVAESGITDPALARQYHQAGFDAVLVGEALVKAADPARFIQACLYD